MLFYLCAELINILIFHFLIKHSFMLRFACLLFCYPVRKRACKVCASLSVLPPVICNPATCVWSELRTGWKACGVEERCSRLTKVCRWSQGWHTTHNL